MHAFQHQRSEQTLAQGLVEYVAVNPNLADIRSMSTPAKEFFRCHDVVHVVYGCDVALNDEAVVKVASILGTTAGLRVLKGYRLHESLQIYRRLHVFEVLLSIGCSLFIVPRTVSRCLAQRARWPWADHQTYMQSSLRELRQHFGIKVAHCQPAEDGA